MKFDRNSIIRNNDSELDFNKYRLQQNSIILQLSDKVLFSLEDNSDNDTLRFSEDTYRIEMAFLISAFPGFFVHGLGHLYVGKPEIFFILFGSEVGSISLLFLTNGYGSNGDNIAPIAITFMIFFTTYIFDIIGSVQKAAESRRPLNSSLLKDRYFENDKLTLMKITVEIP